jgi:hypothetical protein
VEQSAPYFCKIAFEIIWTLSMIGVGRADVAATTLLYMMRSGVQFEELIKSEIVILSKTLEAPRPLLALDLRTVCVATGALSRILTRGKEFWERNKSANLPFLKLAFTSFPVFIDYLPQVVVQYPDLLTLPNNDAFVCKVNALLAQSAFWLNFTSQKHGNEMAALPGLLYLPCSMLRVVQELIRQSGFAAALSSGGGNLHSINESVWALALSYIASDQPPDPVAFQQFMANLIQIVTDVLSVTLKLPQPCLERDQGVADDTKLEQETELLMESVIPQLKATGKMLLCILKERTEPDARLFIKNWLVCAANPSHLDLVVTGTAFVTIATKQLTEQSLKRPALLEALAPFWVALGSYSFGDKWKEAIQKTHAALIECVRDTLAGTHRMEKSTRRELGIAAWALAVKRSSSLDGENLKIAILGTLSKLLPPLHALRLHGTQERPRALAEAIASLKDLEACLYCDGQAVDLQPVLDAMFATFVSGHIKKEALGQPIGVLAERAMKLRPCNIFLLSQLQNPVAFRALIYGRGQRFRDCSDGALLFIRTGNGSLNDFSLDLSLMASLSCEAGALVFESLAYGGLTGLLGEYVSLLSNELSCCSKFLFRALKPASAENLLELRKLHVGMLTSFDKFIDLVESPNPPPPGQTQFSVLKLEFLIQLAELTNSVSQLTWSVANSFVPEMYDADRMPVYAAMEASVRGMKAAAEAVVAAAQGSARDNFARSLSELEKEIQAWIVQSLNIDFCEPFAAASLVSQVSESMDIIGQVYEASLAVVDKLAFAPDVEAVKKLFAFKAPVIGDVKPPLGPSVAEFSQADQAFRGAFDLFARAIGDPNSQSLTLLSAFETVAKAATEFVAKSQRMVAAATDTRLKLAQTQALKAFGESIVGIKVAMRARLLRAAQFEVDMQAAIGVLQMTYQEVLKNADPLVKSVPVVVVSEAIDKRVPAIARVIQEIGNQLKKTTAGVDTSSVLKEDSSHRHITDVNLAKRSLAASTVYHAQPIFQALGKLVPAAQQVATPSHKYGLFAALSEASDAAAMMFVCIEQLVAGRMSDVDLMSLGVARAVCEAARAVVKAVGGEVNPHLQAELHVITEHSAVLIQRAGKIIKHQEQKAKPKAVNRMMWKLGIEAEIEEINKQLEDLEFKLACYRKTF